MIAEGIVDHNIVSIYQNDQYGNNSYVKFGGWDQEAIETNQTLTMMRSESSTDLKIKVIRVELTGAKIFSGFGIPFNINPYLPYTYLPDSDYQLCVT